MQTQNLDSKTVLSFILSVILGFSIWYFWSSVFGYLNPWSSESPGVLYFISIICAGFLGAVFAPRTWWWVPLTGLILGQALFGLYARDAHIKGGSELMMLGLSFGRRSVTLILPLMSSPSIIGAYFGMIFSRYLKLQDAP